MLLSSHWVHGSKIWFKESKSWKTGSKHKIQIVTGYLASSSRKVSWQVYSKPTHEHMTKLSIHLASNSRCLTSSLKRFQLSQRMVYIFMDYSAMELSGMHIMIRLLIKKLEYYIHHCLSSISNQLTMKLLIHRNNMLVLSTKHQTELEYCQQQVNPPTLY